MPLASSASTRRRHLRAEAARLRLESEAEALEEVQTQETQRREKPRKTEADGRQLLRAFAIALACALLLEGAFRVLVSLVRGSGSRGGALSAFDALRASHEDVARALPPPRLYMVIGERNSGANWVRAMLRDNVPADALAPADADDEEALAHAHLRVPVTGVHHRAHHIEEHGEGDERYRLDQHGLGDGASAHSTHVYSYRAHHATPRRSDHAARWRPHGFVDVALGRSAASVAENFHAANETLFVLVVKDPFAWRVLRARAHNPTLALLSPPVRCILLRVDRLVSMWLRPTDGPPPYECKRGQCNGPDLHRFTMNSWRSVYEHHGRQVEEQHANPIALREAKLRSMLAIGQAPDGRAAPPRYGLRLAVLR